MRFSTLASVALVAAASDVVELGVDTFKEYVDSKGVVLAEFFAPWCGHCKSLAPEFEIAATALKEHGVGVAKIDCTVDQELCTENEIQGFPTLLIFEDGEMTGHYDGQRKADDITKFMVRRSQPVVRELEIEDVPKTTPEEPIVVVGIYEDDESADVFNKVAKQHRERLSFAHSKSPAVAAEYAVKSPAVVVLKADEKPVTLTGTADKPLALEDVEEFVKINGFPSFGELGPDNYAAYIRSGIPLLFAFVEDEAQTKLVRESLTPLLDDLRGKANIAFLDATQFGRHAENVNLEVGKWPALVVHDVVSNKKYPLSQEIKLTAKSVSKYVKDFIAGKIAPSLKSDPVPESQDGPVHILVATEYDTVVLDNDKDVLVEFYAPWCGHCKNLAPIYDQLGELYGEFTDKVTIAKINHQDNEVPDEISGYPTIKLFPAGGKKEPIVYSGARTLEALAEFVYSKGTHNINPLVADGEKEDAPEHEDL